MIVVTNNPLLNTGVMIRRDTVGEVLTVARDLIHNGHRLLNHPKYGNIQVHQWNYRTLMISDDSGALDTQSLMLIEDAIQGFINADTGRVMGSESQMRDYQMIDADIILAAIRLSASE